MTTRTWTRANGRPRRALYLSSPIGLGHARRDLAIAQQLKVAAPGPADRLAHPAPGDPGARGGRRAGAPGVGLAGERVGPHRGRVRRARPARLPGDPGDGRDPGQQLHGLPRRRRGDAVRPRDRRRGVGRRLLPAREPRAQALLVRVADRLRRLAADARPRRARGAADRRLQRRDARAASPTPPDPRSAGLRGQPGGRGRRAVRAGAAEHPRVDGRQLRLRGLRHRVRATDGRGGGALPARAGVRRRRRAVHRRRRRVRRRASRCCGGCSTPCRLATGAGARAEVPVVTGPRIDPASLPRVEGVDLRGYVPDLYLRMAAADVAVVQGGLTTTMELAAARVPFLYVPLRHHFEQNLHVHHRLQNYRAGLARGLRRRQSTRSGWPRRSSSRSAARSPRCRWSQAAPSAPPRCWESCCERARRGRRDRAGLLRGLVRRGPDAGGPCPASPSWSSGRPPRPAARTRASPRRR